MRGIACWDSLEPQLEVEDHADSLSRGYRNFACRERIAARKRAGDTLQHREQIVHHITMAMRPPTPKPPKSPARAEPCLADRRGVDAPPCRVAARAVAPNAGAGDPTAAAGRPGHFGPGTAARVLRRR